MANHFIQSAPNKPGCYIMKDSKGAVLYVGKAKNIKKRIASYWQAKDEKTVALVAEIVDIEFIVTDNEVEALILEAELIHKYHPYYNIDLKDGKRYAFIEITKETYPRLRVARRIKKGGKYFGPYPSGVARNAAMKAANKIFGLCTSKQKGKACLRYHLGYCRGVCAGLIDEKEYGEIIKDVERFLKGDYKRLIVKMREEMEKASKHEEFEKAKLYRDQVLALEKLSDQNVSRPKAYDQDVINYIVHNETLLLQLFHFQRGVISGRKEYTFDLSSLHIDSVQTAVADFLQQYYSSHGIPQEVVLPEKFSDQKLLEKYLSHMSGRKTRIVVPQRGVRVRLLDMVKENLFLKLGEGGGQLYELQQALKLSALPKVINCVDISHLAGKGTVGSLVQFVNGRPSKQGYRKFKIRTVEGINDFASMEEVLMRYCERVKDGKENLPNLFVVDGGRGQLNIAIRVFTDYGFDTPLVGLAKRLEEIYVSWAKVPLRLSSKSQGLQVLRALRDEAHRFAITYQRKLRAKK